MTLALAVGHRFPDLDQETRVLAPAGIELVDTREVAESERLELLREAAGILLGPLPFPNEIVRQLDRCRGIVRYGVGVDNVDVAFANARGIVVSRVPEYGAQDVALHAVTLILALARRLPAAMRAVKEGLWSYSQLVPPHRPATCVVGVVGLGRIGREVARLACGLGFEVIAHDVVPTAPETVELVPLDELLARSTFVTLHVPLTPETAGLIGSRELALMSRDSFIVNTARGGLIDHDALVGALSSGAIAGAGLDVLETEPPAEDDPILSLPNAIVTPHMAWYSAESRVELQRLAAEELLRILAGPGPRWAV